MTFRYNVINDSKYQDVLQSGMYLLENIFGPHRKKSFQWKKCTNEARFHLDSIDPTDNMVSFLTKASSILQEYNYPIDNNNYHLDFHRYNLFGEKVSSRLDWHCDDYGDVNYPVNTAIFYLRKDPSIDGGNLIVKEKKIQNTISVKDNTIVLMDGRLEHKPEDLTGFGCRDSIVVQFKRI